MTSSRAAAATRSRSGGAVSRRALLLTGLVALVVGCNDQESGAVPGGSDGSGGTEDPAQVLSGGAPVSIDDAVARGWLLPADATLETINDLPRDPETEELDSDAYTAEQIRRGYRIFRNTTELAAEFSGNDMDCSSCHLNGGQKVKALPLVGVSGLFPQYRNRDAALVSLEERIRGCFIRSMNGTAPPFDHPVTLALSAYIHWLSEGVPTGFSPAWRGLNGIPEAARIPVDELDLTRGEALYEEECAPCHGLDGVGFNLGGLAEPAPLWGEGSWNDGAGAARIWRLAGFIRYAMPLTAPGSLSDEEAQHVSAWINSHDRPAFPSKATDFPAGGRPADAVYDTLVFPVHPLKARRAGDPSRP
ncbi:MAG: c-type cytochrome [Gemmatimonadota bacterium]